MILRILAALAAASCLALSMGGCGSAEPVEEEEIAAQQEAVGARPVNPTDLPSGSTAPAQDNPLGFCTYVCSLDKRWVPMTSQCKSTGVCDKQVLSEECTQVWNKTAVCDTVYVREVTRGCVYPNFP